MVSIIDHWIVNLTHADRPVIEVFIARKEPSISDGFIHIEYFGESGELCKASFRMYCLDKYTITPVIKG